MAITEKIMQLIQQLDALNRYPFRKGSELLAAWKSVRDIESPHPGNPGTATPGTTGPTPVVYGPPVAARTATLPSAHASSMRSHSRSTDN